MAQTTASTLGRLLSARAAARYLGISEHAIRQAVRTRQIAAMRNGNGRLMGIYERHLDVWQQSRLVPASEATAATLQVLDVDERIRAMMPSTRRFR